MEPVRILIADDDPGMRLLLSKLIAKADGYDLVGQAQDGQQALDMVDSFNPQVVILDVEMPVLSGIDCARYIQDVNPKTIILFATAHDKYMADAFSVYAFDYLLKPFKADRLFQTLDMIRKKLGEEKTELLPINTPPRPTPARLMLKHREGTSFLDMDSILLVQREDRSTVLYCMDDVRYVTSESLGDLEKRLPKDMFFRTHKSYVVNISQVDSITPYGRWTHIITLRGTSQDALITHERFDELQKMFA